MSFDSAKMEYTWLITEAVLGPLEGTLEWHREGYQLPLSLKSYVPWAYSLSSLVDQLHTFELCIIVIKKT